MDKVDQSPCPGWGLPPQILCEIRTCTKLPVIIFKASILSEAKGGSAADGKSECWAWAGLPTAVGCPYAPGKTLGGLHGLSTKAAAWSFQKQIIIPHWAG